MIENVKRSTLAFYQRYGFTDITEENLCKALKLQGYTVIYFNRIINNSNVDQVISNLNLKDYIVCHNGFTYANEKFRIVFVNNELSREERIIVLAHEEGHIFCEHMGSHPVIGLDVRQEHEANEFAHYLLHPSISFRLKWWLRKHKKMVLLLFACISLAVIGLTILTNVSKEEAYYGEYYVTVAGSKYHRKNCMYIKNKNNAHRLTKVEFDSGRYEPCKSCLPNE